MNPAHLTKTVDKSLILPREGVRPSFQCVVDTVTVAECCDLTVRIVCLTCEHLQQWRACLTTPSASVLLLDATDKGISETVHQLSHGKSDITILSGTWELRQKGRMTSQLLHRLAAAVPSGMVIAT